MFGFFSKNKKDKLPLLADLNNNPLFVGDIVDVFRYELGRSKLIIVDETYYYQSIESGEKVSWLKMIDASSENQKVKKIIDE